VLPICLLPVSSPVTALMGMSQSEFYDLYIGDGMGIEYELPDIQVIEAFNTLVEERAHALIADWQHREAVINIVSCFAAIASDVDALDAAIHEVTSWLCGVGPRVTLRGKGQEYQVAEALARQTANAMIEDQDAFNHHVKAAAEVAALARTCTLNLAFGDIWIDLALLSDRVRVTVDLPEEGEIDMDGHHWDGDEDADDDPVTPPLEMV